MVEIKSRYSIPENDLSHGRSNFRRNTLAGTDSEPLDFPPAEAEMSADPSWRLNVSYWKARAFRAQAEVEQNTQELRRIRHWMEEIQGDIESLRREQRRTEESLYEGMLGRPNSVANGPAASAAAAGAGLSGAYSAGATALAPTHGSGGAAPAHGFSLVGSPRAGEMLVEEKIAAALEAQAARHESQVSNLQAERDGLRSQVASLEEELNAVAIEREKERSRSVALEAELAGHQAAEEDRKSSSKKLDSILSEQEKHVDLLEGKLATVDAKLLILHDALRAGHSGKPANSASGQTNAPHRPRWRRLRAFFSRGDEE